MKKILLQGAMDEETDLLIEEVKKLSEYRCYEENGLVFHQGTRNDRVVIVSKTGMGTVKAGMATTYALLKFQPTMVINQGTAGAQVRELSTGDVVLVWEAVNVNAMRMPKKKMGEGSDPFTWEPRKEYYKADEQLFEFFVSHEEDYSAGKIIRGRAATGDIFSREDDRIIWLEEQYNTLCEDMESAAVFEVCERFQIPCMGLRIISNNELLDEDFNLESAKLLQEFIWKMLPLL